MKVLPENYLRLMTPEARKAMGKAGQTASETLAKAEVKNERDLQKQVLALLQLHKIEAFYQRMDKRTRGRKGQPDFLFAVNGRAIAWECKTPDGKLSGEQDEMLKKLSRDWRVRVIRSVAQAVEELNTLVVS